MQNVEIENVFAKVGSIFKLVVLAALRASELTNGAPRLIEAAPNTKVTTIALLEIEEGRVTYKAKKA